MDFNGIDDIYVKLQQQIDTFDVDYRYEKVMDLGFSKILLVVDKLKNRGILIPLKNVITNDEINNFPNWVGINITQKKLSNVNDNLDSWYLILSEDIQLLEVHPSIFVYLVKDILSEISHTKNFNKLFTKTIKTLLTWKQFFDMRERIRFSKLKLQGLFGEISFLEKILDQASEDQENELLDGWQGIDYAKRDFKYGDILVEVKTSNKGKPYSIAISSEEQLELVEKPKELYLWCLMLESENQLGMDILEKIEVVEKKLSTRSQYKFQKKLHSFGVIKEELKKWKLDKFLVRDELAYTVKEDFPNLSRAKIPEAVYNVKYSIALDQCESYKVPVTELDAKIKGRLK